MLNLSSCQTGCLVCLLAWPLSTAFATQEPVTPASVAPVRTATAPAPNSGVNPTNVTASTNSEPDKPRVTLSFQDRGDIFMARKMYREAIDTYLKAPTTAVTLNKVGIAYHQLTELDAALKYYMRAFKVDPKFAEAVNNVGTIYYSKHSYRRAISQYKKSLRIKPNSASTLANMASAYFARKQYELAQENLDLALAIDPNVLESRGGVGTIVRESSVLDRPTFFYTLAKSYAKKGLNERAMNYIRKALEEGFKEREKFTKEPEFNGLHDDPEFQRLMTTEPKVL